MAKTKNPVTPNLENRNKNMYLRYGSSGVSGYRGTNQKKVTDKDVAKQ